MISELADFRDRSVDSGLVCMCRWRCSLRWISRWKNLSTAFHSECPNLRGHTTTLCSLPKRSVTQTPKQPKCTGWKKSLTYANDVTVYITMIINEIQETFIES